MSRVTLCIYVTLKDQQVTYQEVVVRLEGKIAMYSVSILIDIGSILLATLRADPSSELLHNNKTPLGHWPSRQ